MRNLLPLFAILIAGCAGSGGGTHAGEAYMVNTQRTLFYKYGPAQVPSEDVAMYKGERVTMLNRQFGYSQVIGEGGQTGYIATEDLVTAPKEKAAPPGKPGRRGRNGTSRAPTREEEATVPPPDLPKPQPEPPIFRY